MLLRVHHQKDQSDAVLEIETASNHLNQRNLGQEPPPSPFRPGIANDTVQCITLELTSTWTDE